MISKKEQKRQQYLEFEKELNIKLGTNYGNFNSIVKDIETKFKLPKESLTNYVKEWKTNYPNLTYFVDNYNSLLESAKNFELAYTSKGKEIDYKVTQMVYGKLNKLNPKTTEFYKGLFIYEYLIENCLKDVPTIEVVTKC